jgi:uncharacterized protein (TIGR00251 family)
MRPGWTCLRAAGTASVLDISVSPNARRTAADGLHDGALRVRLAAPPVDGKANAQLLGWLADELGCPKRAVTLLRGDTSRRKQVRLDLPEAVVAAWLAKRVLTGAE